jgi:hypothetical protein
MTSAWHVFSATLLGVLVFAIQKLGATVIIFAYLYSVQHLGTEAVTFRGWEVPITYLLVAAVTILSILLVSFKSIMISASRRLDARCIHVFDGIVIHHLYRWDLSVGTIRSKSLSLHAALKIIVLFTLLSTIAAFSSLVFPAIVFLVILATGVLAYRFPTPAAFQNRPHLQPLLLPENYGELILIFGLLVGFLFVAPDRSSLLGSVAVLLLIARFSGQLRVLAKTLARLSTWRKVVIAKQTGAVPHRFKPKSRSRT